MRIDPNFASGHRRVSLGAVATTEREPRSSPDRMLQEALKNALDRANNNLTFVQGTPCAFSFA